VRQIDLQQSQVQAPGAGFQNIIQSFQIVTANGVTVGNGQHGSSQCPAGTPTTIPLTADVVVPAGGANPFVRLNFYRRAASGGSILIGTSTSPTVTDGQGTRTFRFAVNWTPTGEVAQSNTQIQAVGIAPDGQSITTGVIIGNVVACR
jgi:hypothetical protein